MPKLPKYSENEGNGKYLDLEPFFSEIKNIEGLEEFRKLRYSDYLKVFDDFQNVSFNKKKNSYKNYLEG